VTALPCRRVPSNAVGPVTQRASAVFGVHAAAESWSIRVCCNAQA